jgi:hypothetical protein
VAGLRPSGLETSGTGVGPRRAEGRNIPDARAGALAGRPPSRSPLPASGRRIRSDARRRPRSDPEQAQRAPRRLHLRSAARPGKATPHVFTCGRVREPTCAQAGRWSAHDPDGQSWRRGSHFLFPIKAPPSGRRAALCPMQPQALARGVRPPAGPRAARGCHFGATDFLLAKPDKPKMCAPTGIWLGRTI